MFSGEVVWKGIVYTLLMIVGKTVCGVWLLRLPFSLAMNWPLSVVKSKAPNTEQPTDSCKVPVEVHEVSGTVAEFSTNDAITEAPPTPDASAPSTPEALTPQLEAEPQPTVISHTSPTGKNPQSLYPASILGCAMTARGEIGFLISSVADRNGIFARRNNTDQEEESSTSNIFLIVTWAIVLCTVLGPLSVGLIVQRVKKLQRGVEKDGRIVRHDVLGAWGIN